MKRFNGRYGPYNALRCFGSSRIRLNTLPPIDETLKKFEFKKLTHTIDSITQDLTTNLSKKVTIHGWINSKPRKISKNLIFAEIRDTNGDLTQILANADGDSLENLKNASMEDAICVTGSVEKRRPKKGETESVHWDILLDEFITLNKSNEIPSQLQELTNNDEYPPNLRFLQLRQKYFQDALKTRAKLAKAVRDSLNSLNFTEIETPLLFKSTPEGAREFLVPTRRQGQFYALPQSPQQYKQLLMASGVNKYYQIAKCFRDEDLRKDRQPEFTQIDLELLFSKPSDVQEAVGKMVRNVWKQVRSLSFFTLKDEKLVQVEHDQEFSKLTYKDLLEKYGIDKPDLRSSLQLKNLSEKDYGISVKGPHATEFPIFEICVLRQAFNSKIPSDIFDSKNYSNRKPIIVPIKQDQEDWVSKFESMIEFEDELSMQRLVKDLDLQKGDIIAGGTRAKLSYENPTPLGKFRQLAIELFPQKWRRETVTSTGGPIELDPKDVFVATWVVDFPLFSPVEISNTEEYPVYDYTKYTSTHHPFTMCKPEDYTMLSSDPLQVHGEHYDLVVNGVEVGGGSRRIHDTKLQRYIFLNVLKILEPEKLFGHLLAAFDIGCPPHSGLAIGFDRMCLMLVNSQSIRDVVAFPKSKIGSDAVVGSPSGVTDNVLSQYHIRKID